MNIVAKSVNVTIAHLETSNFNFQAIGINEAYALKSLKAGWKQHCKEYQLDTPFSDFADSVWFSTLTLGQCNRDGVKII